MHLVLEDPVLSMSGTFPLVIFICTYKRWRYSSSEPFTFPWTATELRIGLNSSQMIEKKNLGRRKEKIINNLGGMILIPEQETSKLKCEVNSWVYCYSSFYYTIFLKFSHKIILVITKTLNTHVHTHFLK